MAFGNVPVDPPEKKAITPPAPSEPPTTYVEGPVTRIRKGTSTLNDLEKTHKLIEHLLELKKVKKPDKVEYFEQDNSLSISFMSDVIGKVHLRLLGSGEPVGDYKKIKIEYQNSLGETKSHTFSIDEINEEAFKTIQELNDDCCVIVPK